MKLDAIRRDGYFLSERLIDEATIEHLIAAFQQAEGSHWARTHGGDTYALRNILKAVPGVYEAALLPSLMETICEVLGPAARPVKAILFDKTSKVNWHLRWHQDNVISVRERIEVPGFHGWSEKVGIPHVRPPVQILEQMLAARLHIDDCAADNGALQVIPGSHLHGRLSNEDIHRWREEHQPVVCAASKGQVLFMRPLLLHSSDRATAPHHRRVLHIEYAGCDLPNGLEWGE